MSSFSSECTEDIFSPTIDVLLYTLQFLIAPLSYNCIQRLLFTDFRKKMLKTQQQAANTLKRRYSSDARPCAMCTKNL